MFLANVLRRMRSRVVRSRGGSRHAQNRRCRARPLIVEALEERCLLSSYHFTLLADDGPTSFFVLPGPATGGIPTINDHGTVAFQAGLKSGGEGVFTRDTAGNLEIIATASDLISGFRLSGGINDAGTVGFGADLRDGTQAIFTGRGGPLSRVADIGPDSPFSSFISPGVPLNNEDTVSFVATLKSGGTGIFTGRAGEPPSVLYVTGGRFAAFQSGHIQRNGNEVAFRATLSTGGAGIFLGDGLTTTTIATTGDTYSAFAAAAANDLGVVFLVATLTAGGQAILKGDGTELTTILDTSGPFSSFFGALARNNDGEVVFTANLAAGGSGIFSVHDGVVDEIIGTGDSLLGSTVTSFGSMPFAPQGLNDVGQLGFAAHLADGRTVLVRADPVTDAPLATVASVVVNDASAQRSMVTSLTVTFSSVVHLDPGALELVRQEGGVVQLDVAQAVVDGNSVDALAFVGAGIIGGSLADGHYTLTIHGGLVHDDFGQALDGAGTGVAGSDRVDTFFRFFGDSDGNGHVDLGDLLRFGSTFGKHAGDPDYLW